MYVITTVREIIAVCVSIVSCVSCFHSDVCRLYFIALHVFAPVSEGAWGPQHGTDERPGCKCRACLIRWLWGGSASLVSVLPCAFLLKPPPCLLGYRRTLTLMITCLVILGPPVVLFCVFWP